LGISEKISRSNFIEARSAGHSAFEPEIVSKLVGITDKFQLN
jgi:hypothetical protein